MKKPFSKLTKPQQRVAVAKDVIARIKTRQFTPEQQTFAYGGGIYDCDVQDYVKKGNKCAVCAKGGLFMSYVGFVNKFHGVDIMYPEQGDTDTKTAKKLLRLFSIEQLDLIEQYFEGWQSGYEFTKKYKTDRNRLLAICENIVKNKGVFIP